MKPTSLLFPHVLAGSLLTGIVFTSQPVRAEYYFSVYGGSMITHDSDVKYRDGASTDIRLDGVQWQAKPFSESPYGGYRLGYWCDSAPNWGISAEWIHGKMYAENENVSVSGVRNGSTVSGTEPLGNTFSELSLTHGLNLYLLNLQYRWFLADQESDSFCRRLQPYVGVGAGIVRPHIELTSASQSVRDYVVAGPAAQGFLGMNFDVAKHVSLFAEYKLTYADIDADLPGGGSLRTKALSHHFTIGVTISLGGKKSRPHSRLWFTE